jgi:hypothetical protein
MLFTCTWSKRAGHHAVFLEYRVHACEHMHAREQAQMRFVDRAKVSDRRMSSQATILIIRPTKPFLIDRLDGRAPPWRARVTIAQLGRREHALQLATLSYTELIELSRPIIRWQHTSDRNISRCYSLSGSEVGLKESYCWYSIVNARI